MKLLRTFILIFAAILLINCVQANSYSDNLCRFSVKGFYKMLLSDKTITEDDATMVCHTQTTLTYNEDGSTGSEKIKACGLKNRWYYLPIESKLEWYSHDKNAIRSASATLQKIRQYKKGLTQGLDYESIAKLLDSAEVSDEGEGFSTLLKLTFSNGKTIYFEIGDGFDSIEQAWFPSGESLEKLTGSRYAYSAILKRPGIINDPDGYTNIREKPDKNSVIAGKFTKNEIFYYTPISDTEWWPVYKTEAAKQLGYIYKDKILEYAKFPQKLKDKVKEQRGGC